MISFLENTTSSKMACQNDDFIIKENCKFLFTKSSKWMASGQNAGNSEQNLRIFLSLIESNLSCPSDKFLYCFGRPYDSLVIMDNQMKCEYGSLL